MNRLTREERRRVFLNQQRTQQAMLARLAQAPVGPTSQSGAELRGLQRLLKTLAVASLVGGAVLASRVVEFHPPASLIEALLPRL